MKEEIERQCFENIMQKLESSTLKVIELWEN